MTRAAKILRIKRPTAKIIIKRYQQTGTFFNKKMPDYKEREKKVCEDSVKVEDSPC